MIHRIIKEDTVMEMHAQLIEGCELVEWVQCRKMGGPVWIWGSEELFKLDTEKYNILK